MPNNTTCSMKITGPQTELDRFAAAALDTDKEDNPLSLSQLYPIPKELVGTASPTYIITEQEYKEQEERIAQQNLTKLERLGGISRGITQELSDSFIEEYGENNWYDWAVSNWGTKWGTYDCSKQDTTDCLIYNFQSAWSAPIPGFLHVSRDYPELEFQMTYEDEGASFIGKVDYCEGEITFQEEHVDFIPSYILQEIECICDMTQEEAIQRAADLLEEFEHSSEAIKAIEAKISREPYTKPKPTVSHF